MSTLEELKQKLEVLALPIADAAKLELVELNVRRKGSEWMIQVLADTLEGGISLEECSVLNRKLVEAIDAGQLVVDYSLEVSSPGIDRPLKTKRDFQRALHEDVRFHLSELVGGKKEYVGIVTRVNDTDVVIETQKHGEIKIPIGHIVKAVLVFD
ncbi:MAG: ribosome maturation factor RimP [Candidatus Omnitrophica bacterium]|nr:ribosome maturation factor RimP [Candidatus Omnitrophota bacterium]